MSILSNLKFTRPVRGTYNVIKQIKLYFKYYNLTDLKGEISVIFCVDGRLKHGGLADRFYGIICCYAMCKIKNFPFKINFIHPFILSSFLRPNIYDWEIDDPNLISHNIIYTNPVVELGSIYWYKYFNVRKQTHFYSNFCILDQINKFYNTTFTYSGLFKELFKPAPHLENRIESIKNKIGTNYVSVCFRFQSLLGDFKESTYLPLSSEEKHSLMKLCTLKLEEIRGNLNLNILVTSDSITFINHISELPYIYTIPGDVVHMDYVDNSDDFVYEKSFVDFYMLGGGDKIINICGCGLRRSGFPVFASECFQKPIEFINLE